MTIEQKAEEYAKAHMVQYPKRVIISENGFCTSEYEVEQAFIDGYHECQKEHEWHYVKNKLPPSGETVLLYFGTDIMGKVVMCTGCVDCKGNWYKNIDGEPIKWQEITLPKEIE